MTKSIIFFAVLVVFVSGHTGIRRSHKRVRVLNCTISGKTMDNYKKGEDLIFTFLETAEVDFRKMSDDEKTISCQLTKGNLSEIIIQGKRDLINCFVDEYEYFGGFLNDVLQNFINFFCESGNEDLEEYFSEEAKQCRASIVRPLFDNCLNILVRKKDELCRQLFDLGTCTDDLLESHCATSDLYRNISAKLIAQTVKPCNEYDTYFTADRIVEIILTICFVILVIWLSPVRRWITDFWHRATSKSLSNSII